MDEEIYLDANATSPVLPAAVKAAQAALASDFGNPSSSHGAGLRARAILDDARARARRVLGAATGRIMFTSGATEGIQTAVLSALCALRERRAAGQPCGELLLYGATEHKAVPESLAHWNRILGTGFTLQALPVGVDGRHRLDLLRELAPRTAFLCTMAANNESGVVSDLDGIAAVLEETGSAALWMVDCVQALGKLPLALDRTRIDYAPFSGHKLYAPKGIGLLYAREGAPFTPLICGGGQEGGQRSGTENMAGIAAFGAVLAALEEGGTFPSHVQLAQARERLVAALRAAFPAIEFNTPLGRGHALPTTLNFAVPGMSGKELLDLFDAAGVRVSAGSACSAAKAAPSYVLQAMGLPDWRCANAVRLSFGPLADDAFIDAACRRIAHCAEAAHKLPLSASRCGAGRAGVYQFVGEGGWLVFDPDRRECVAIDVAPALAGRVALLTRQHGYRLRAVLRSDGDEAACLVLREQLDAGGWPVYCDAVSMDDGSPCEAIRLGCEMLVRRPGVPGYLLGSLEDGVLRRVRLAFGGEAEDQPRPADAIVCGPAGIHGAAKAPPEAAELRAGQLARFFAQHPDALLIDVREACEHAAGTPALHGRAAYNLPLSRLAEYVGWLRDEARPLVFFCRSGNRSLKAVQVLQGLGRGRVWHLAGGLALNAH